MVQVWVWFVGQAVWKRMSIRESDLPLIGSPTALITVESDGFLATPMPGWRVTRKRPGNGGYKAEGQLRYGDLVFAGRRIGTVKAMSLSGSTQDAPTEKVILKSRSIGISSHIQNQQRRLDFLKACRQTGTVRARALLAKELEQIVLPAETPARRPDPPFLLIDEVGPSQSSAFGPTPRFAQLSCLRGQRSR